MCISSEAECHLPGAAQSCAIQNTFLFRSSPHVDIISSQWEQKWRSLLHSAMITLHEAQGGFWEGDSQV